MAGVDEKEDSMLAPDEAFAVLGNEVRIQILRALANAGEPLSFSGLFDRIEYDTASNFSYHLDKLTQHFVRKTDEGYGLTRAGERVVEAVLSGAVTEAPVIERTRVDQTCHFCGASVEVQYQNERLDRFCTECSGMWGSQDRGFLGSLSLPPAGLRDRSADEAVEAAWTWRNLDIFAIASGLCPKCSGPLDRELDLCTEHEGSSGGDLCGACDNRYAARVRLRCPTCIFDARGTIPILFIADTEFLAFLTSHGCNPFRPDTIANAHRVYSDYEEEIVSMDPFEGRFTFTAGGDTLKVTVDENLEVVETTLTMGRVSTDGERRSTDESRSAEEPGNSRTEQ